MWELRWVLIGLGAVLILAVYAWGQGHVPKLLARLRSPSKPVQRTEPSLDDDEPGTGLAEEDVEVLAVEETDEADTKDTPPPEARVDRVIAIRYVPEDRRLGADKVILALRAAGLRHGRYGIFHRQASSVDDEPLFSVANLTEPGSFDLTRLSETTIPGMSFFMVLPGVGDPVERFDMMIDTARSLARELGGDLRDEKGSSWSIQRERYIREEIIAYRHQAERSAES